MHEASHHCKDLKKGSEDQFLKASSGNRAQKAEKHRFMT